MSSLSSPFSSPPSSVSTWANGSVFGLSYILFFVPLAIFFSAWFWHRRNVQPIKARSPFLVIVTNSVLILYVFLLCIQRIMVASYPCFLNLWSGYIGTIVLFNAYLWRCWTLYFTYNLTQEKLAGAASRASVSSPASLSDSSVHSRKSFFLSNQHLIKSDFLAKFFGSILVLLLLPAGLFTASHEEINSQSGDGCSFSWAAYLLAAYVVLYVTVFSLFAFSLRGVMDGFKIKAELKSTGIIGILAVVPWFLFNNISSLKTINENSFPFSTVSLIAAATSAFITSTIIPLFESIFQPPILTDLSIPSNLNTLAGLIGTPVGLRLFQQFLSKEFSVENILFYQEVEELRRLKRSIIDLRSDNERMDGEWRCLSEAKRIFSSFIGHESEMQINLPGNIVKLVENNLRDEFNRISALQETVGAGASALVSATAKIGNSLKKQRKASQFGSEFFTEKLTEQEKKIFQGGQSNSSGRRNSVKFSGSSSVHQDITEISTVFDAAQMNIYHLMEKDSLPRFMRSELYKEFLSEMRTKFKTKEILEELNVI
jgi:hypothetical protein